MTALIFAQTLFYLTVSLAIIVFGILLGIIAYHFIAIAKQLRKLSEDLNNASEEVQERVSEIMDRLAALPLFSFLLKNSSTKKELRKGRAK
ncbi:MAG: hypothetical protein HYY86_02770 [Candidatus Harrisonbacteria bacterium]|nr:hypothetical protein [Candidatus Harrisonbacteria bacterium]